MRILGLTNLFPNPLQPHRAAFNRQQLKALSEAHAVRVIAPVAWTDELSARRQGKPPLPPSRRVECDGIPVEHPRYLFPPKVLRGWYGHCFRRSVRPAFDRAVAEFRPDIVFASWAYPDGWAAVDLARRAGLPVVIKVHGSDVLLAEGRRLRPMAAAVTGADGVVAVSRDLADRVVQLGASPANVRVVYSGVNTGLFHPGPKAEARARLQLPDDTPMILFVGNLLPVKGLDILVDACERLVRQGVRFSCCLLGQGAMRSELERQIAGRGLDGTVKLVGSVAHGELPDWFRAADVFVLPSRSEGVPNVLLEAAACGTPFVASKVGGIPEIADLAPSVLVPPEDPAALAATLAGALSGGLARDEAARPFSRSQADVASELSDMFQGIIDRHRRAPVQAMA